VKNAAKHFFGKGYGTAILDKLDGKFTATKHFFKKKEKNLS